MLRVLKANADKANWQTDTDRQPARGRTLQRMWQQLDVYGVAIIACDILHGHVCVFKTKAVVRDAFHEYCEEKLNASPPSTPSFATFLLESTPEELFDGPEEFSSGNERLRRFFLQEPTLQDMLHRMTCERWMRDDVVQECESAILDLKDTEAILEAIIKVHAR